MVWFKIFFPSFFLEFYSHLNFGWLGEMDLKWMSPNDNHKFVYSMITILYAIFEKNREIIQHLGIIRNELTIIFAAADYLLWNQFNDQFGILQMTNKLVNNLKLLYTYKRITSKTLFHQK